MDALPRFDQAALLLDLDGTLLDIAPTPGSVVVRPGLVGALRRLVVSLGGAVAIVTGRPVEQVEALLGDAVPTISGEHGGALRPAIGAALLRTNLPDLPVALAAGAVAVADGHPGVLLERKARGFVMHYRQAPDAGPALHAAAQALLAPHAGQFQLLAAHMAWEVRPLGADKGTAVQAVMALPPFAGRLPVFIGDDVTDEDAMRPARALGGAGLFVPDVFGDAAGVRGWLDRCRMAWAPLPERFI